MCLAYTSFAVRMLQGRDILKSTAAALPAEALLRSLRQLRRARRPDRLVADRLASNRTRARRAEETRGRSRPRARAVRSRRSISRRPRRTPRWCASRSRARRHRASAWRCSTAGATRRSRHATNGQPGLPNGARRCSAMRRRIEPRPSSSASRTTRTGTPPELVELLHARRQPHASAPASTSATTSRCSNRRSRP